MGNQYRADQGANPDPGPSRYPPIEITPELADRKLERLTRKARRTWPQLPYPEAVAEQTVQEIVYPDLGCLISERLLNCRLYRRLVQNVGRQLQRDAALDEHVRLYRQESSGSGFGDIGLRPGVDPYRDAVRGELKRAVAAVLDKVGERDRMIFILYSYEELTFREIGVTFNISAERARQRYRAVIAALRSHLRDFQ